MRRAALAAAAVIALAAPQNPYRYSRSIATRPGWMRLELPDDVLNACRPGMPDLRIEDAAGKEVPYVFEKDIASASRRLPVEDLESVAKRETSGSIDRGPTPGFADAVTFEIPGDDFLKPVLLQSSDDRSSWRDVAKGSLFATADVRMLTLRFPRSDRRYLRFRLDDRNGAPVQPAALVVRAGSAEGGDPSRERPLAVREVRSEAGSVSAYSVVLPAANLAITALRFQAQDPAFSRAVRVYERVLWRDEVFRRIVGEGTIARKPGAAAAIDLPVCGIADRNLEVEIENGDSPALSALGIAAMDRRRDLRFLAREGAALRLRYGSPSAHAPRYDLGRALEGERGAASLSEASLGPANPAEAAASTVSAPPRARLADPEKWAVRRAIRLPERAGVAYLDLVDTPSGIADLRIVDEENRQVAFIAEQGSHEHRRRVAHTVTTTGARTRVAIQDVTHLDSIDGIELTASGPDYFARRVTVLEEARDQRGVTGARPLGTALWVRQPGEPAPALRLPIDRPLQKRGTLLAEIENGDNVPLAISDAWISTAAVRIDFVFRPGERLYLLSGNPEAGAPSYDLAMLAGVILSTPADAAGVSPSKAGPASARTAPWFWAVVALAALMLVFELSRTLRPSR